MDLFDFGYSDALERGEETKRIRVLSLFSGIGAFEKALDRVGIDYELVNFCEIDRYASKAYCAIHGVSEDLNLEVKEYSVDELYACSEYYMLKAAEYADKIERKDGVALYQDFYEMAKIAGASYEELAGTYPVFEGTAVPVKKLSVIGEYLMYNGIVGMFMPITGEAGVPGSVPVVPLGFTMCHEAGHRLGLAGEEEANFAAFLACIYNKDVRFLYSGYYNAFSYCFSALYRADSERAKSLLESHQDDPGVKLLLKDRQDTSEYYRN